MPTGRSGTIARQVGRVLAQGLLTVIPAALPAQTVLGGPSTSAGPKPPALPTLSIVSASAGALIHNRAPADASIDFGRVSYYGRPAAWGTTFRKNAASMIVSTRFGLRADCEPGSRIRVDIAAFLVQTTLGNVMIDGIPVGPTPTTLVVAQSCNSKAEHRLDIEVSRTASQGPVGANIGFLMTTRN